MAWVLLNAQSSKSHEVYVITMILSLGLTIFNSNAHSSTAQDCHDGITVSDVARSLRGDLGHEMETRRDTYGTGIIEYSNGIVCFETEFVDPHPKYWSMPARFEFQVGEALCIKDDESFRQYKIVLTSNDDFINFSGHGCKLLAVKTHRP